MKNDLFQFPFETMSFSQLIRYRLISPCLSSRQFDETPYPYKKIKRAGCLKNYGIDITELVIDYVLPSTSLPIKELLKLYKNQLDPVRIREAYRIKKHGIEFVNKTKTLIKPEKVIKPEEIWIVCGGSIYCLDIICGYKKKEKAEAFIIKCNKYNETRPRFHIYTDETVAIEKKWEARHPAGKDKVCDRYYLSSLLLRN
jgi:hypothetical protein